MLYSVHTKPHSCAFQTKLLNLNAHERASLPLFTFHLFCWASKKDAFQEQVVPVSKSMLNMIFFYYMALCCFVLFSSFFPFLLMRFFFFFLEMSFISALTIGEEPFSCLAANQMDSPNCLLPLRLWKCFEKRLFKVCSFLWWLYHDVHGVIITHTKVVHITKHVLKLILEILNALLFFVTEDVPCDTLFLEGWEVGRGGRWGGGGGQGRGRKKQHISLLHTE